MMTPAELAIRNATHVVEEAGAHPLLTKAVCLMGEARDKVADFVDGVPEDTSKGSGWLIEILDFNGSPARHYLGFDSELCWTDDSLKAIRFARKEDAEAMGKGLPKIPELEPKFGYVVNEHGWG